MMHYPVRLTTVALLLVALFACRKETFTTDSSARLWVGTDTVHFDTVFTTTGATTKGFKIFNRNKEGIRVQSIRLAGGATSPFKININGQPGPQLTGLEIRSGDSAYVFVSVYINPTAADLPFIVSDSVEVLYNGNTTTVQLQAYGQNAHFIRNGTIAGNQVWHNDKPYLITGGLTVQEGAQLTISKGCRIFVHANTPFRVEGSLKVEGDKDHWVTFASDRLDEPYRHHPGGWQGIQFSKNSRNNSIRFAEINNAYQALVLHEPAHNSTPVLSLQQVLIDNALDAGIQATGSSIEAQNAVISNCGKNLVIQKGGQYNFTHCTLAAYTNSFVPHKQPLVLLSNYAEQAGAVAAKGLQAIFRNSILWGESSGLVKDEVMLLQNNRAPFAVTVEGVLWNADVPGAIILSNPILQNPQFRSTEDKNYDFRLTETSPAINIGVPTGLTLDADGNQRPVGRPDLGAYEQQ